jgi:hypothetical protein
MTPVDQQPDESDMSISSEEALAASANQPVLAPFETPTLGMKHSVIEIFSSPSVTEEMQSQQSVSLEPVQINEIIEMASEKYSSAYKPKVVDMKDKPNVEELLEKERNAILSVSFSDSSQFERVGCNSLPFQIHLVGIER